MNASFAPYRSSQYELRFHPLGNSGRAFAFRCDASGQVDLDRLSSRERDNYLYARVQIGREFTWPLIEATNQAEAGEASGGSTSSPDNAQAFLGSGAADMGTTRHLDNVHIDRA